MKRGRIMKKLCALILAAAMLTATLSGCANPTPSTSGTGTHSTNTSAASSAGDSTGKDVDFPKNSITVFCGYSAGGGSDYAARVLAEGLSKELGVPVIVENITGSGGWVLWNDILANESKYNDGYSIVQVATPNWTMASYDTANPREYKYDALDLVANMVSDFNCIAIRKGDDRFQDFDSFINYWKEHDLLTSANASGIMSDDATMTMRISQHFGGLKYDVVQTGGGADSINMLMNGSVDFQMGNVSELAGYDGNEFTIICVFADERQEALPDVPTFKELTGESMVGGSNRGFALPKGVDDKARTILVDAICKVISDPATAETMATQNTTVNFLREQDYIDFLKNDMRNFLAVYGIEDDIA